MAMSEYSHSPVLFDEVLEFLGPKAGDVFVDCTLGLGGHARGVLSRIVPGGVLLGIDADKEAISIASRSLKQEGARIFFCNRFFSELDVCMSSSGLDYANAFLFDLGVSSMQFDNPDRGFSFRADAPLDMRMGRGLLLTASDIVNKFGEDDLRRIFAEYGEEPLSDKIAKAIVAFRRQRPIDTTLDLVRVVESVKGGKRGRLHPATRVFQALRIVVNDELSHLKEGLNKAFEYLAPGGRIGVISFHSLEDRLVKRAFKERLGSGWRLLTKKPVRPSDEEVAVNPRSRSAKLRVIEKL